MKGRSHRTADRAPVRDPVRADDQAVSFARPLERRPLTIARPARVRMRRRNPCTRARRRLFGWKVRLPLATVTPCAPCGHAGYPGMTHMLSLVC